MREGLAGAGEREGSRGGQRLLGRGATEQVSVHGDVHGNGNERKGDVERGKKEKKKRKKKA